MPRAPYDLNRPELCIRLSVSRKVLGRARTEVAWHKNARVGRYIHFTGSGWSVSSIQLSYHQACRSPHLISDGRLNFDVVLYSIRY